MLATGLAAFYKYRFCFFLILVFIGLFDRISAIFLFDFTSPVRICFICLSCSLFTSILTLFFFFLLDFPLNGLFPLCPGFYLGERNRFFIGSSIDLSCAAGSVSSISAILLPDGDFLFVLFFVYNGLLVD